MCQRTERLGRVQGSDRTVVEGDALVRAELDEVAELAQFLFGVGLTPLLALLQLRIKQQNKMVNNYN